MTAIGFLMLVIGTLIHRIWGVPFQEMPYKGDYLVFVLQVGGFFLLLIGIFIWLYRVMP